MSNPTPQPSFGTVAIVGVGLLGGSLALALRRAGSVQCIIGVGRSQERLQIARSRGLIDEFALDIRDIASEADIIVFCTPVRKIPSGVISAAVHCKPETLITDVGSVKRQLCRAIAGKLPAGVTFIGSHPLAGSEKQGFEFADANLFNGRICVITPEKPVSSSTSAGDYAAQVQRLTEFWQTTGAIVKSLSAEDHDCIAADISHLPHLIASTLSLILNDSNRDWAATGFRDTTRIASGDPSLWTDILLDNADRVLHSLRFFELELERFREAIEREDHNQITDMLALAKQKRDALNERRDSGASPR
ncbi:MAG: prephenate dehydrogenase [Planctomycetaceae bacterium]